jgi:hypothetical protein
MHCNKFDLADGMMQVYYTLHIMHMYMPFSIKDQ